MGNEIKDKGAKGMPEVKPQARLFRVAANTVRALQDFGFAA